MVKKYSEIKILFASCTYIEKNICIFYSQYKIITSYLEELHDNIKVTNYNFTSENIGGRFIMINKYTAMWPWNKNVLVWQSVSWILNESKLAPSWNIAKLFVLTHCQLESQLKLYKQNASVCSVSVEIKRWKLRDYNVKS